MRGAGVALALVALALAGAWSQQLSAGPLVGHGSETEVRLWVQITGPAGVAYRYWPEGEPSAAQMTEVQRARKADAFCVHTRISGLPFGTRFRFALVLGGRDVELAHPLRFQTQPHWRWRRGPPDFTVATGSCAYVNDPLTDRPGKPYGGDPRIFQAIARKKPDLMLWLGDNIYFREPDWTSEAAMRARYTRNRRLPELQALLGAAHNYAIWDDHDYGSNDSDWTFPLRAAALKTFKLFWANPGYGHGEQRGVFTRFTWGDAEFFLLDDRYYRSPNAAPQSPTKTMFGLTQLRWLLDSLTSSTATFKVIAGGNQFLNPLILYESLGHFPYDQHLILQGIAERKVGGVIFLSGDRHHSELIRREAGLPYPLYDFTCSPLLSRTHEAGAERHNPARVPGTLVVAKRNFGLLSFSGAASARVLRLSCHDPDGAELWQHTLRAADLRPR